MLEKIASIRPPAPNIAGSPGGPTVTGPRIMLRDGRHLAYKEYGVPREEANHKFVFVHGFGGSRHDPGLVSTLSPEFVEEVRICIVAFDKPGYGESDPHPSQSIRSLALDIEELGDQLELGDRFYVIGSSMGGQGVWGCLKYIPDRLAGAVLLAPVVNYWWRSLPADVAKAEYSKTPLGDQWALRVAHHAPWLTYWWNTQKLFPASSVAARKSVVYSGKDLEIMNKLQPDPERRKLPRYAIQQGEFESIHRAMMIGFGKWEFEPVDIEDPFPNNEGCVHLWQGDSDKLVPVTLQRYIVSKLSWIKYHEISGAGHLFARADGMGETIIKEILGMN